MTDSALPPEPKPTLSSSMFQRLRGYFFAGVVVTAPIAITLYLTWSFLRFMDSEVTPLIPPGYNPNSYLPFSLPGMGLLAAIVFFITVGWFAKNIMGRFLFSISEYIFQRVPVINTIYKAIKQMFETIMSGKSQTFRDVVMFEFPRKGIWGIGLVAGAAKGEIQTLSKEELVTVFMPAAINPTSGFVLFIPRKELVYMKISVDEAIKMIVSGGILAPQDKTDETSSRGGRGWRR
jgi:uncharacterized membrane protein